MASALLSDHRYLWQLFWNLDVYFLAQEVKVLVAEVVAEQLLGVAEPLA